MAPNHEWLEKDFYKTLGVSESCSEADLTKAYRKLARKYHPDANPDDSGAEDRFKEISAAYEVLGDPDTRAEYDQVRKMGPMGGFTNPGGFPGGAGGGGFSNFDVGNLGDLLGNIFGGNSGRAAGRGPGPQRGEDLEAELHLSFTDAIDGVTTSVHVTSDAPCRTCAGSGAAPGTSPSVCEHCHGRGVLDDDQGFFSFSQPCPSCGGRGRVITNPCPTCHGGGIERVPRTVKVRIPAGVKDGQRIRLKGKGGPGRNGGPNGNLVVKVLVGAHPLFGRDGDNLTLTVPVTFAEAALGTDVRVPTVDGSSVRLRLPAGTPSGKTFRVRGKGAQSKSGAGDLLVSVEVVVPTQLTDDERAAIEALAAADESSPREFLGVEP